LRIRRSQAFDRSLAIITALLCLAEIENSRRSAAFGSVPFHEMLREVCDIYEPIAENRNIDLRVEVKHRLNVCGDRDLLFEAVANLVDNAIKFTPEGGRVEIELIRCDSETIVRVIDTGCGISELGGRGPLFSCFERHRRRRLRLADA
jgi:signal transduction histidine kinase